MEIAEQQLSLVLLQALERTSLGTALSHDQLFYYRSSTGAEIDFVAAAFDGVCFESKHTDGNWSRTFQTIEASSYQLGMVATRSGAEEHRAGWALPAPSSPSSSAPSPLTRALQGQGKIRAALSPPWSSDSEGLGLAVSPRIAVT